MRRWLLFRKKRIAKNVTREPEIHMIISPRRRKYLRNEWENEYRYLKKNINMRSKLFFREVERYRRYPYVPRRSSRRHAYSEGEGFVLGPKIHFTGFLLLTSFPSRHLPIEYGIFSRILSFVSFYLFSKKKYLYFLDSWPAAALERKKNQN